MARRKRGKRMPKIEPAVRTLMYQVADGTSYIDISKDLSMVNRRMYRQGMSYVIQDIQIAVSPGVRQSDIQQFSFSVAGNSWVVHNAWTKAFNVWREQQKKVTDSLPGIQGKWADFKIFLDDSMEDGTTLTPYAGDGAVYTGGDWDYSRFVFDDDGTEKYYKMHLIGSSNFSDTNDESAIGLIHEYSHSRPNVHIAEPDVESEASDTIYSKLLGTDEMSDLLVGHMENENDIPPYDQDEFPGGETNADAACPIAIASVTGSTSITRIPGFVAECGLIKVGLNEIQLADNPPTIASVYEVVTAATCVVLITVAPGPYRGVLAAPMGQ